MEELGKGFILSKAEAVLDLPSDDFMVRKKNGEIKIVKSDPDPNMKVYPMLPPISSPMKVGKEPSKYTLVSLEIIQPGASLPSLF